MAKTPSNLRCNEQIRISPVRLIGPDNEQIGIVDNDEAQRLAREAGLDLVEIAPRERPPVCRIMDYGKFKYNQKKKSRKHHEQQLKEVRLRPKTDQNDRIIKINRALKFLSKNDKVQFTMQFRGRERAHREVAIDIFNGILAEIGPLVKVERPPSMDGRHMIMIVAPNKPEFEKLARAGVKPTLENVLAHLRGDAPGGDAPEASREPAPDSAPQA
ncbi:MAG: translation initiation factor IF-3 [Planctomycetota bacterium]|nr:MAG: translation initiation factor IF-3 [Planctomycetota bacterium]